jgi:hypothetical protein
LFELEIEVVSLPKYHIINFYSLISGPPRIIEENIVRGNTFIRGIKVYDSESFLIMPSRPSVKEG